MDRWMVACMDLRGTWQSHEKSWRGRRKGGYEETTLYSCVEF